MTTTLSFLFVLGVLVFVHELGHFLVARWHGVRVITFSLGFGPKIAKFVRGGTEYCISIIPLGGYVKMAGETVEENLSGAPDEFLSKPKWVRFQVYIAGPIMNIALAWVVLAGVLSHEATVPLFRTAAPVIGVVTNDSPAAAAGLRAGDRVLTVDDRAVDTWDAFEMEILMRAGRELSLQVARADERVNLKVTPNAVGRFEAGDIGVGPVERPQISQVNPGSPAERAGLLAGDVVIAVSGERQLNEAQVRQKIRANGPQPLALVVERGGQPVELSVVPEGAVGASVVGVLLSAAEFRRIDPSLSEALWMSAEQNWEGSKLIGRTLRGLFTADTPMNQLAGPVEIARMSGTAAQIGWIAIFNLMAVISLNLGLFNLLPVPVLDGGHIAILAVEGLARRDLSLRVKERILTAGAVMIVLLMVTVIFNDVSRLLR